MYRRDRRGAATLTTRRRRFAATARRFRLLGITTLTARFRLRRVAIFFTPFLDVR